MEPLMSKRAPYFPHFIEWRKLAGLHHPGANRKPTGERSSISLQRPAENSCKPKRSGGSASLSRWRWPFEPPRGGSVISRLRALWKNLSRRNQLDDALDEELRSYLESLAADKMQAGMNGDEAYRAARREMGGVDQV